MNIQDYIEYAKERHIQRYRGQSAAEVLLKKVTPNVLDWYRVLREGGYYDVQIKLSEWEEMHRWLRDNVGEEHYTWTGATFWFEDAETAAWAALKWA